MGRVDFPQQPSCCTGPASRGLEEQPESIWMAHPQYPFRSSLGARGKLKSTQIYPIIRGSSMIPCPLCPVVPKQSRTHL